MEDEVKYQTQGLINSLSEQLKVDGQALIDDRKKYRLYLPELVKEDFALLMSKCVEYTMIRRGKDFEQFRVTDRVKLMWSEYFKWLTKPDMSNFYQGLLFSGNSQIGKSLNLYAFFILYKGLIDKYKQNGHHLNCIYPKYSRSDKFADYIVNTPTKDIDYKVPLFLDELGRELSEQQKYGNHRMPMAEWLFVRGDFIYPTFATSNFIRKELEEEDKYGKIAGNRLGHIFKEIILKGEGY